MIRKADLVRQSILDQLAEARDCEDSEEIERLEKELAYLEAHRDQY
jgi:hypothetical protein